MNPDDLESLPEKGLNIPKEFSSEALLAYTRNEYYVEAWAGGKPRLQFNFWAALFGSVWCMYMKLYKPGFILALIGLGLLLGGTYFYDRSDIGDKSAIYLTVLSIAISRFIFGFLANGLYLRKAEKDISILVKSRIPQIYFGDSVKSSGGVNFGAALFYGLGWSIVASFAIEMLRSF